MGYFGDNDFFNTDNLKDRLTDTTMSIGERVINIENIKSLLGEFDDPFQLEMYSRNKINRFSFQLPAEFNSKFKGYIFMTRPDLNINENGELVDGIKINPYFDGLKRQDPEILDILQSSTRTIESPFINIFTNRFEGLSVPDITLETYDTMETIRGNKLSYARHTVKSKLGYSFSLALNEDKQQTVYKLIKTWIDYTSMIQRGVIKPKDEYRSSKVIDYASSLYYFVVGEDGETILFYAKLTGIIPENIPSSTWSTSEIGWKSGVPKHNINFKSAFFEEYDPSIIAEFNNLTGGPEVYSNGNIANTMNVETLSHGKNYVSSAFVETTDRGYKLKFIE